jgi:hypothetical protein
LISLSQSPDDDFLGNIIQHAAPAGTARSRPAITPRNTGQACGQATQSAAKALQAIDFHMNSINCPKTRQSTWRKQPWQTR